MRPSSLTALFLVAASAPVATGAPSRPGPPCICHPLDIGAAESLPFGKGPFDVEAKFPLDKVVPETLRILAASEEPLVHMETIRRAAIYLSGIGGERKDPDSKERAVRIDALIDALQNRAREAGEGNPARTANLILGRVP